MQTVCVPNKIGLIYILTNDLFDTLQTDQPRTKFLELTFLQFIYLLTKELMVWIDIVWTN